MVSSTMRRADFLGSVTIVDFSSPAAVLAVQELARQLAARLQFWEIVVILPIAEETNGLLDALIHIPNLRVLRVDDITNFYRLRLAAVSEAIGDVVISTTGDELALVDLAQLCERVYESNDVIVMSRSLRRQKRSIFFEFLGRLTGYHIDPSDTLTIGFPRSWLSVALARPDAELLLRFESRTAKNRFRREQVPQANRVPRRLRATGRRLTLLADLMASAAPRILRGVATLSLALTVLVVCYAVYAVLVWIFKADVAPGWLTTNLLQSLIAAFLGIAVSAISIGIVKLFDRLEGLLQYTIVDEFSNTDYFNEIKELNVIVNRSVGNGEEAPR